MHGEVEKAAEPCFGRIISGYDVIKRIQKQPLLGGENNEGQLLDFVTILDAVVVRMKQPAVNSR